LGADASAIIKRYDEEEEISIRRALLLSLGEYRETESSLEARKALLPKLKDIYRTDPDAGLHAASAWLLRQWQQRKWLEQLDDAWAMDGGQREQRLDRIRQELTK
jgi:hypothetical protein